MLPPPQQQGINISSNTDISSITAIIFPEDSCSIAGTTVSGPAMPQAHPEDSLEAVSSHDMTTIGDVASPKEPESFTTHDVSSQSSASSGPEASTTPVQSLPKTPETITASGIPHQSSTITESLAQTVPTSLPNQTVSKGAIRAQIMNDTGRFDVNSISSMEDLIFVLTHHRHNIIRIA
ncbi:hypothetical protein A1F94_009019 [Pyrenophora tritici-repentis]|nr:hypothetical protein A1F94_009019 [Pyrenophora tritici-repentis]